MRKLLAVLLFAAAPFARAQGNDKLLFQVREIYGIGADVPLSLGDAAPSELHGFKKATLTIGQGAQKTQRSLYLTDDGQHWFIGDVHGLAESPDQERMKQVHVEGPVRGKKGASVTVVEFSDIECPYCKRAHLALEKELMAAYGDKIQWVFKQFPLTGIHPWAEKAAVAAECAKKQDGDKFWSLLDLYYENQEAITPDNLREKTVAFASQVKLDPQVLGACLDNMDTLGAVRRQTEEGDKLGVNSTPTFLINGHLIQGYRDFAPFKELIDEMLAGKHGPKKQPA